MPKEKLPLRRGFDQNTPSQVSVFCYGGTFITEHKLDTLNTRIKDQLEQTLYEIGVLEKHLERPIRHKHLMGAYQKRMKLLIEHREFLISIYVEMFNKSPFE